VVDVDAIDAMVARCRQSGHSSSDGEIEAAVRSMSVPIRAAGGETIAAMSISVRADRMTLVEFERTFLPLLKKCRDQLEARLNG
jgi:IclR family pca regulon transcriptional regulator